jgi:hypothetical protein
MTFFAVVLIDPILMVFCPAKVGVVACARKPLNLTLERFFRNIATRRVFELTPEFV